MRGRLVGWWCAVQESLWFIPTLLTLTAVLRNVGLVELDRTLALDQRGGRIGAFGGGTEGTRGALQAIAGSRITQIRHFGTKHPTVAIPMLDVVGRMTGVLPPAWRSTVRQHAALTRAAWREQMGARRELARVEAAAAWLAMPSQPDGDGQGTHVL